MIILSIMIFAVSFWCVFSHRFGDGIVTKHLLSLSAIFAAIAIINPHNGRAFWLSFTCLSLGFLYWYVKHHKLIHARNRLMKGDK